MLKDLILKVRINHYPIEDYDQTVNPDEDLGLEVERIVFSLDSILVTLLLLKYIGYDYKEIVDIMGLKNINEYYQLLNRLRREVKKITSNDYN